MNSLINVGDEIVNAQNLDVLLTSVERGHREHHGLLVKGKFIKSGNPFQGYLPYELPPIEMTYDWYNWAVREAITLKAGMKLGLVASFTRDRLETTGEYDARWERTIKLMQENEGTDNVYVNEDTN